MNIQTFTLNPFQQHTYILWEGTEAAIIDAGFYTERERESIVRFIDNHQLTVKYLLLTHAHLDHIFGVRFLAETYHLKPHLMPADERLFVNLRTQTDSLGIDLPDEPFMDYTPLTDGQILPLGDLSIQVLATPGHTPGGCCYLLQGEAISNRLQGEVASRCLQSPVLFSGDTLFAGTIGRTDLPGGSLTQLIDSIHTKLSLLSPETMIYAGHGAPTTLDNELKHNPYLQ